MMRPEIVMFDQSLTLHDYDVIRSAFSDFQLGRSFRASFREVLLRRFEGCDPDLADKLKRLDEDQLDALHRRLVDEQRLVG